MNANVVELLDIRFSWQGPAQKTGADAFQLHLDEFFVRKYEKVFLHGASGAGKSTLLGLICGTMLPRSGRVSVNAKCLNDMTGSQLDRHRADNIGIIFQMFNLLAYMSALENVLLPLEFSKSRRFEAGSSYGERTKEACRLLERLGLDSHRDGNANPVNLSVGQQQRVAVARALIGGPRLVIADEPTSALDEQHQESFLELLFSEIKQSGASLLMVSHNRRLAQYFDRTVSLENGSIGKGA